MWEIGAGFLMAGSAAALSYAVVRYLGHRLSPANRGRWTIPDGDLRRDFPEATRRPFIGPDPSLLKYWTDKGIPKRTGIRNTDNQRRIMAMLHSGNKIGKVNDFIMTLKKSGTAGSTHRFNLRGDYDFDLASWTTILHLFGDDPHVLFDRTVDHIVSVMMAPEKRNATVYVPGSLGTFLETENHVLMTEGSYYLCSKWLEDRKRIASSGHPTSKKKKSFISSYLDSILHKGFYEFNSDPYSSYTAHALLNLASFGSDPVRAKAIEVLDRTCYLYILGSSGNRRFPPFRRRRDRGSVTSLLKDGMRPYMLSWEGIQVTGGDGPAHALVGALLPYRPPKWSDRDIPGQAKAGTILMGHGPGSSPEIYSRGKGFLITGGGVYRGPASRLVNRPTTLLLNDGAVDLGEVVHIGGRGRTQDGFNNTGVVRDLAIGPGPVHVPEHWDEGKTVGLWTIYRRTDLSIMVHSMEHFGAFCVRSDEDGAEMLSRLNSDPYPLDGEFAWGPDRSVTYDVNSRSDRWSIRSIDGRPVDRKFDGWPKLKILEF